MHYNVPKKQSFLVFGPCVSYFYARNSMYGQSFIIINIKAKKKSRRCDFRGRKRVLNRHATNISRNMLRHASQQEGKLRINHKIKRRINLRQYCQYIWNWRHRKDEFRHVRCWCIIQLLTINLNNNIIIFHHLLPFNLTWCGIKL